MNNQLTTNHKLVLTSKDDFNFHRLSPREISNLSLVVENNKTTETKNNKESMQTSILEKARAVSLVRKAVVGSNPDELNAFIAFLKGEIHSSQLEKAMDMKSTSQLAPKVVKRLKAEIQLGTLELIVKR